MLQAIPRRVQALLDRMWAYIHIGRLIVRLARRPRPTPGPTASTGWAGSLRRCPPGVPGARCEVGRLSCAETTLKLQRVSPFSKVIYEEASHALFSWAAQSISAATRSRRDRTPPRPAATAAICRAYQLRRSAWLVSGAGLGGRGYHPVAVASQQYAATLNTPTGFSIGLGAARLPLAPWADGRACSLRELFLDRGSPR